MLIYPTQDTRHRLIAAFNPLPRLDRKRPPVPGVCRSPSTPQGENEDFTPETPALFPPDWGCPASSYNDHSL